LFSQGAASAHVSKKEFVRGASTRGFDRFASSFMQLKAMWALVEEEASARALEVERF
jgi:hypothetical protein